MTSERRQHVMRDKPRGERRSGLIASPYLGLLATLVVTIAGVSLARAPGLGILGPVGLTLLLAMLIASLGMAQPLMADRAVSTVASVGLRAAIVLMGVRVDLAALIAAGPNVLLGGLAGVVCTLLVVVGLGKVARVPRGIRWSVGIGTAICGASAVAAAMPVLRTDEKHAATTITAISMLGTIGAMAFAAAGAARLAAPELIGQLAGASLQEIGQVLAAASVLGPSAEKAALLVKLARVLLLAPVLVVLGWWERRRAASEGALQPTAPPPLVPSFIWGFLALSAITSLGWLPPGIAQSIGTAATVLMAAAMAAIGLRVDFRTLRGVGGQTLILALGGFAFLAVFMYCYYALLTPHP